MIWQFHYLMAVAFDNNINRDPSRDEWKSEVEEMPDDLDLVKSFAISREPKSIYTIIQKLNSKPVNVLDRFVTVKTEQGAT